MLIDRFYVVFSISLFPYFSISLFLPSFCFCFSVFVNFVLGVQNSSRPRSVCNSQGIKQCLQIFNRIDLYVLELSKLCARLFVYQLNDLSYLFSPICLLKLYEFSSCYYTKLSAPIAACRIILLFNQVTTLYIQFANFTKR